tara:strand:- start:371 stop:478 length:108 start_codon:yes stop_codon:yes gene_type:complete
MGFDPTRAYKPKRIDYLNIALALLLIYLAILWALS